MVVASPISVVRRSIEVSRAEMRASMSASVWPTSSLLVELRRTSPRSASESTSSWYLSAGTRAVTDPDGVEPDWESSEVEISPPRSSTVAVNAASASAGLSTFTEASPVTMMACSAVAEGPPGIDGSAGMGAAALSAAACSGAAYPASEPE